MQCAALLDSLHEVHVTKDEVVAWAGERGDSAFLVERGQFHALVPSPRRYTWRLTALAAIVAVAAVHEAVTVEVSELPGVDAAVHAPVRWGPVGVGVACVAGVECHGAERQGVVTTVGVDEARVRGGPAAGARGRAGAGGARRGAQRYCSSSSWSSSSGSSSWSSRDRGYQHEWRCYRRAWR